ncbi:hypothetical protein GQ44DRAFT_68809 [Phaeosphaeriaceae sp. PMI808]|nr:hypothetical protein GQ44DRAFT_68809 [Phaeosphaeriaceae sp. PMI808]
MDSEHSHVKKSSTEMDQQKTAHITWWLKTLSPTTHASDERVENGEGQQEKRKTNPTTPARQVSRCLDEEVSPTDTLFSRGSIFDSPYVDRRERNSSSPQRHLRGNESNATSVSEDNDLGQKHAAHKRNTSALIRPKPNLTTHRQRANQNTDNQLSTKINKTALPTHTLKDGERSLSPSPQQKTRFVKIVSCLQCTLSNLPCSRTLPTCTRCTRNGRATLCLAQRGRFYEEVVRGGGPGGWTPLLLKVRGDDEEGWRAKVELAERLKEGWEAVVDRRNWVFPRIETDRRGVFGRGMGVRDVHPGEGEGMLVFRELVVDEGTILDNGVGEGARGG